MAAERESMLIMKNVSKTFNPGTVNEKCALNGVNLTLGAGDFATIVGSNGAGKSTLFNAITGAFFPDRGLIMLGGEDITYQQEHVRSKVIGHLFQDPLKGTAPHMTIEENMALAYLRTTTSRNAYFSRINAADKKKFREQLALLDMGLEMCIRDRHEHHHDHDEHDHEHHHDHDDHDHEHHHDHDEHDHEDHDHEHHHDHDEHDHEDHDHEHHHDHDEHDHEHHHEHGENCTCGCHDHDHEHHHHHADEVFTSWGKETPHKFTKAKIEDVLKTLCETDDYGTILRAKGMVEDENGSWIYFDMVPGEYELRDGEPDYTGRLCVIGTDIDEHRLEELFGIA